MSVSATGVPERLVPGTADWEMYRYEHQQRYAFAAPRAQGRRVLDIACGVGYGSHLLACGGAREVLGVDISEDAIAYAREHYSFPAVQFQVGDAQNLELAGAPFDMAVSFETIEHLTDPDAFVCQVQRALVPGGLFICSTPNADFHIRGENEFHLSEMTFDEFCGLFGRYFQVEERYHQSHSAAYLRHVELVSELARLRKPLRHSKLLRFENAARRFMGMTTWEDVPASLTLGRAVPGDYEIEPVQEPSDRYLTYILVGRSKA